MCAALVAGVGVAHADYPALSGTPVVISTPPPAVVASSAAVATSKTTVTVALVTPAAATSSVVKYIITLKPLAAGVAPITKTITAVAGRTVKPKLSGKSGAYRVVVTAVSKSGKSTSWTGPKVTLTGTLPATR
jgi:hypothetical protein